MKKKMKEKFIVVIILIVIIVIRKKVKDNKKEIWIIIKELLYPFFLYTMAFLIHRWKLGCDVELFILSQQNIPPILRFCTSKSPISVRHQDQSSPDCAKDSFDGLETVPSPSISIRFSFLGDVKGVLISMESAWTVFGVCGFDLSLLILVRLRGINCPGRNV